MTPLFRDDYTEQYYRHKYSHLSEKEYAILKRERKRRSIHTMESYVKKWIIIPSIITYFFGMIVLPYMFRKYMGNQPLEEKVKTTGAAKVTYDDLMKKKEIGEDQSRK